MGSDSISRLITAGNRYNRRAAEEIAEELIVHVRSVSGLDDRDVKTALSMLRRKRWFDLLQSVADALIQTGQDAPYIRRMYAQALIDQGMITAAIAYLERLITECADDPVERDEAEGLLGRAFKQAYVLGGASARHRVAPLLERAIAHYYRVYAVQRTSWHGINAVALLARAARDGVRIRGYPDSQTIAAEILDALESLAQSGRAESWDFATASEACVALGRWDDALYWLNLYIRSMHIDLFEIGGSP